MEINAKNVAAIRRKLEAEKPFVMHKKGEYRHRWSGWNPNAQAIVNQEIVVERWDVCTATALAGGKMEVTTTNRRLMSHLDSLHKMQPDKCRGGMATTGVATYTVEAETWKNYLAAHTEAEPGNES